MCVCVCVCVCVYTCVCVCPADEACCAVSGGSSRRRWKRRSKTHRPTPLPSSSRLRAKCCARSSPPSLNFVCVPVSRCARAPETLDVRARARGTRRVRALCIVSDDAPHVLSDDARHVQHVACCPVQSQQLTCPPLVARSLPSSVSLRLVRTSCNPSTGWPHRRCPRPRYAAREGGREGGRERERERERDFIGKQTKTITRSCCNVGHGRTCVHIFVRVLSGVPSPAVCLEVCAGVNAAPSLPASDDGHHGCRVARPRRWRRRRA